MKQIFRTRKGEILVDEVPSPSISPGHILVKNIYSVISTGTELRSIASAESLYDITKKLNVTAIKDKLFDSGISRSYKNFQNKLTKLSPLGYSSVGVVVDKADDLLNVSVGDFVACMGFGVANHAQFVKIPKNLFVKIPKNVNLQQASFISVAAICMHSIRRANLSFGDSAVVLGLGLLGQICAKLLKLQGVTVIGIDNNQSRIELAQNEGSIDKGILYYPKAYHDVLNFTNTFGVDAIILCNNRSSQEVYSVCANMLCDKGKFVIVGNFELNFPYSKIFRKEIDIFMSRSTGPGRFDPNYEERGIDYPRAYVKWTAKRNAEQFLKFLSKGDLNLNGLISKIYPFNKAKEAYDFLKSTEKPIGVILDYETDIQKLEKPNKSLFLNNHIIINKDKINVAVIGIGAFAKNVLIPILEKNPNYKIKAIVSSDSLRSKEFAKQYGADYCTTDYNEVLKDSDIDLVMILTKNNMHAEIAINASKHGKAIFLEKPMAMNLEETKNILKALKKNKNFFTLGLNRRYSPMIIKAREILSLKRKPIIVNYRINEQRNSEKFWVEDPAEGGGRILHMACHTIDVICNLIDSEPISLFAYNVSSDSPDIIDFDNVSIVVKFRNGSVANFFYTAMGNSALEREKIEIYAEKSAIVINNFEEMLFYGIDSNNIKFKKDDKGYHNQFNNLALHLKGNKSVDIVSLKDALRSQLFPLYIHESLKSGKPIDFSYNSFETLF